MGFGCVIFGDCDYLAEGSRDDASGLFIVSSHHCMGFPTSCLPICEDSAIVAIQYAFHKCEGTLLIDDALQAIWWEYCIEGKAFRLLFGVFFNEVDLSRFLIGHYDTHTTLI